MKSVLLNLLALFVAILCWDAGRAAAQGPISPAQVPAAQVPEIWLMLKNGSTFSARMLSAGERVKLRVNEGDIEIRASEIALTGFSLTDLAEQQWALLHQAQLDKQFPFVDWCTRYHLYEHAEAALAQMALNGQDMPRVKAYQVRLTRLREIHTEQKNTEQKNTEHQAAAAPLATVSQPSAPPAAPALPPQAAWPQAAPPQPVFPTMAASTPSTGGSLPPTPALTPAHLLPVMASSAPATLNPATSAIPAAAPGELKQAAYHPGENPRDTSANTKAVASHSPNPGTLSPAAVELFASRVQPWVVSRCSNVGCHEMNGTNSYKLERYSKQEAIPRATTLKNLAATTRLILTDKPEESPLLVMANRAHGTSLVPPITAGDGQALSAFREFVALATGRELPKETKPDPANSHSLNNLPGHVTPGRATFPASAVDEPTPENKSAKVINQNAAGWQAAIERQKAYDAEAQKLKDLELSSQRANEARGLIVDPTVKQASVSADVPAVQAPAPLALQPSLQPQLPEPKPEISLPPSQSAATLLTPVLPETKPATLSEPLPQLKPNPNALPESLLPKSIAKANSKPEALLEQDAAQASPAPKGPSASAAKDQPAPPINLNRPRRKFPLPPEDTPPSKAVGTGETKRR